MFVDIIRHISSPSLGWDRWVVVGKEAVIIEEDEPKRMAEKVRKARFQHLVVSVKPKSFAVTRQAFENRMVDIVMEPYLVQEGLGLDHICLKKGEENGVALGISFRTFLLSHHLERAKILRRMRKAAELAKKYSTPIVLYTEAREMNEVRGPREVMSLLINLGLDYETAMKAVSHYPEKIVEVNERKIRGLQIGEVWIDEA